MLQTCPSNVTHANWSRSSLPSPPLILLLFQCSMLWYKVCTPRKMIDLMWTPRSNVSVEMESPWSNEGPHVLTVAPQVLCIQGWTSDWALSFSHYACLLPPSESTTVVKPWHHLAPSGLRPTLSNPSCANYILICNYADQSDLYNLDLSKLYNLETWLPSNGLKWEL